MKPITCKICNKICKSNVGLVLHITQTHKLSSKEYYYKYLKKEGEGLCTLCGNKCNFKNISSGYYKYCSTKCSANSNITKNKRIKTNLEKYGDNYGFQNNNIKEKIRKTNLEKYGVEFQSQRKEIKNKIKHSNLEKYGVEYVSQNNIIKNNIKNTKLKTQFYKVLDLLEYNNLKLLSRYEHNRDEIILECIICNHIYKNNYFNIQQGGGKCPNCFPVCKSNKEYELLNFIKNIESSEIYENYRKVISPYELDIYIPSKNIAIEFDGIYWHSEKNIDDKNYHLNKTNLCEEKNIKLIHIFEDEWIYKQDIVKSRLKQILGINNSIRIHARKCIIKEILPKIKNEFLNKYHIQGEDKSNIKLGAFYKDELISIMTFSHGSISRKKLNDKSIWELSRFCSNNKYHIPGIASKLLTYFKRKYEWKDIISYADRRWSDGNLYNKIGFELDSITKPNYWYVKNGVRLHRFNLRKKYHEPKDIPEWVLRSKEGYYRIWDCGHLKFKMNRRNK